MPFSDKVMGSRPDTTCHIKLATPFRVLLEPKSCLSSKYRVKVWAAGILSWNNNRLINTFCLACLYAYNNSERGFHEICYQLWEELLTRFSFNLNRTVWTKNIWPSTIVSELIGVYVFTLRMCLRIHSRGTNMIVAPLLYAWKTHRLLSTWSPYQYLFQPSKLFQNMFVDTSWNLCPATFSISLRQCYNALEDRGCYRYHMLSYWRNSVLGQKGKFIVFVWIWD